MLHTRYAPGILLAAVLTSACTLQSPESPLPTGPSEMSLSLSITATPDVIAQDGGSQALITIVARDANSQPIPGLSLMVQTAVNGSPVDYGTLSAKSVVTDSQGRASVVYTAPPAPPATQTSDVVVRIVVTPLGNNYDSTMARDISIRLSRPGVILPPNGTPVASFTFAPSAPRAGDEVAFDASGSTDDGDIVSFEWNWGDGDVESTTNPVIQKDFEANGTYTVRLTVVDDRGLRASSSDTVTVGTALTPTAAFTVSPTDPGTGTPVHFDASTSQAPTGRAIVEYRWNYGDGTTFVTTSAAHTKNSNGGGYSEERTYTVTLTVVDSEGATSTTTKTVTVAN